MRPQKPPVPSPSANDYLLAMVVWLLFPALCGAVFTRRRFGLRAVGNPARYVLGTLAFAAFHDLGGMEGHWRNPPFLHSVAWDYFLVMYAVSLWRLFGAWRAFRRREQRHSWSMGEPYLMLLGLPYRLACALDAALIFAFGDWVERYDVALGVWLMAGGCGLGLLILAGAKQQFQDVADLMDAGFYAGNIQDRVEQPDTPPGRRASASASAAQDEVSTRAQGRRWWRK